MSLFKRRDRRRDGFEGSGRRPGIAEDEPARRRGSRGRGTLAVTLVGAMISVGMIGAAHTGATGATGATDSNPDTRPAGGPTPVDSDELAVAIGATVAVTTDQKGNYSPFNLFLINGQISGEGSGTVTIPTGPDSEETIEVDSSAGEVETFTNLQGAFKDEIPVGVSAEVTVDGEEVDPDEAHGLTGDVVIKYKFQNKTSRRQTIEIQAPDGSIVTKEKDVPVPFGGTFQAPFGEGWYIKKAEGMSQQDTADGTTLGATVIAFPVMEGVGSVNPEYVIRATADNASLPGTLTSWVPVNLSTYVNGLALDIVPGVEKKVIAPINSAIQGTAAQIVSIGSTIGGFAGAFDNLNTEALDPLFDSISALSVDPNALTGTLLQLGDDLDNMGELMDASSQAQLRLSGLFDDLAKTVGVSTPDLVASLAKALDALGPDFGQAATGLTEINKVLIGLRENQLQRDIDTLEPACTAVGNTSSLYGYGPLKLQVPGLPDFLWPTLWGGSDGYEALDNAISDNSPPLGRPPTWVADLEEFQSILDDQSTETLPPVLTFGVLPDLGDGDPGEAGMFQRPRCENLIQITEAAVIPIAQAWDARAMAEAAVALKLLGSALSSDGLREKLTATEEKLARIGKVLSNDRCVLEGAVDAIANGEDAGGLLDSCGVAQLFLFLAAVDAVVGGSVVDLSDLFTGLTADVPIIDQKVQDISDAGTAVKRSLNELPGVIGEAADKIIAGGDDVSAQGTSALRKAALGAAEMDAMLLAMTQRVIDGDGAPYGGARGPNTRTLAAYQFTTTPPTPAAERTTTNLLLAAVFLAVAIGVVTLLARRRRNR